MKLSTVVLSLATSSVLALPTAEESSSGNSGAGLVSRQTLNTITDQLLYSITLPAFETRRNNRDPSNLDWSSDGCSTSPDNPFGFPFVPACHRHDFGYRNYKIQSRFTDSGKLKVDNNFKTDLYYQCESVTSSLRGVCRGLADVYYSAVRAFGGSTQPGRRDDALIREYEEKVAIYNQLVKEAQDKGLLPVLE